MLKILGIDFEMYLNTRIKSLGDCVVFTNKPNAQGYAFVSPTSLIRKTFGQKLLHRAVYTYNYGVIPSGMCVMHTCDNRRCINIDHLKLGTWADNNLDRKLKGRNADTKGENHPGNKLSTQQVHLIKSLKGEFSAIQLSQQFGVCVSTIYYIWQGKRWRHL